jgi:hypothetical protein
MVDFNLEEKLKNGIKFSELIRSLFLYSTSIFIAFFWSDFLKETLLSWFPQGQGIIVKAAVGMLATFILVLVGYLLVHQNKHKKTLINIYGDTK